MIDRRIPGSGGIVSLFARHKNAANLVMILMIIFGVFSIGRINTQFFPTVETDTVTISVSWTGASAEDVVSNVLAIIEPEVRFIDGVNKMESYAREGSASISLEFVPGTNMQKASADVESVVKSINNLPEEAEQPTVSLRTWYDRVARIAVVGPVPESTLRIHAKKIRDDLIDRGIERVDFEGLRDEELHVDISERELRRLGLSVSDVSQAIAGNSRDLPSGQTGGDVERQIRAIADIDAPGRVGNVEIRSYTSGEKVLIKDIASISREFEDGQKRGFSAGERAIELTVQRTAGSDTLAAAKILDDYLAEVAGKLPPGIKLLKYEVRSDALTERIMLLVWNGLTGLLIVVGMLFIFLNARIAFWVAAGIPVAMLATIGLMLLFGQSINMLTLFAMIMMLGVIVDDAIVVGEHTATRFSMGDGPYEAAENGAGRMVTPVMAAMITTIAAFAPILMIGDVIGQIMGVLPIVVIAVVIASLVECFLILPGHLAHTLQPRPRKLWSFWRHMLISLVVGVLIVSLLSRSSAGPIEALGGDWYERLVAARETLSAPVFTAALAVGSFLVGAAVEFIFFMLGIFRRWNEARRERLGKPIHEEGPFRRGFDFCFNWFRDNPFRWFVKLAYSYRYVTIAIAAGCVMVLVVGLIQSGKVKFVFFPSPESENLRARIEFNAGIPEPRAFEIITQVENSLYETVEEMTGGKEELVTAVFTTLGGAGRNVGDNLAEVQVQLTSSEVRTIRTSQIERAWRRNLPKLAGAKRVSVFAPRGGPPGRDIDLEIFGDDIGQMKLAAAELTEIVQSVPGMGSVNDDLPFGKPELVMELLPRGAALGFTIEMVGQQVRSAFDGAIPRRFARGDDEITIRVYRIPANAGSAALRNFELKAPDGNFVPLTEVVSLREQQGFAAIQRQDGRNIVSITGDLDTDVMTTQEAVRFLEASAMPQVMQKYALDYQFGGRDEERKKAFADLYVGIAVALTVIYIVLAWVFSNYFRPIAIMLIIPMGIVGAVYGHYLLDFKLTILSLIGLLGLAGILVNDSIILVSRLDERIEEGESVAEAAVNASCDRLRAVLLTSLTTIGGLFPLMFEKSIQAQFLLPMAITIVFGLAAATLLVLFLVPALIGVGDDIRRIIEGIFGAREHPVVKPRRSQQPAE